jgi:mannose/fructose/N-acetylgalactosamine-specific phosphotransferase system component IIB
MRALAEAGLLAGRRINLGGLHASEGRRRVLTYVCLTRTEEEDLKVIAETASRVTARDLPAGREVELRDLVDVVD